MSCIWYDYTFWYKWDKKNMRGYRNKTDKYNWLSRRYRRRNRHPRWSCKKHRDFCILMDSFENTDNLTIEEIRYKLQPFLLWLKCHYELVLLPQDNDYRSGFETYGYNDVKADLSYISDRWRCSFRVRWLINLLEPDYKYDNTSRQVGGCQ